MKRDGIVMTGGAAHATTVTGSRIDLHFFIHRRITDRPVVALAHTVFATVTSVADHFGDPLAAKHHIEMSARVADAVGNTILIAIADAADERGLERPHRMDESFFVELAN